MGRNISEENYGRSPFLWEKKKNGLSGENPNGTGLSRMEIVWNICYTIRGIILLDRCTGGTATHEEILNSLLRTYRLQRTYLL